MEEEKVACPIQEEVQQKWKRTSVEKLRIRAEVYCGKDIPEEVQLLELGWMTEEVVVSYLVCERCRKQGCHVEDNREQGVISSKKQKALNWCGCKGKRMNQSSTRARDSRGTAREEKAAWPRKAKA